MTSCFLIFLIFLAARFQDFRTCFKILKTVSFFRAKQVYLPEFSLTKQKKVGVFVHLEYSCVSASAALRALARVGYSCLCVCLLMCLVMYLMMCLVVSLVVSFLASLYVSLYVLCFSSCSCSLSSHKKNICSPSHVISFIHCLWSMPDASRFGAVCNCQIDATWVIASIIARSSSSQFRRYQCTFYKKNLAKQDSNLSQISSNSSTSTHFPNISTTPKLSRPRPLTDDWLAASEFLMQKGKQRRKGQAMP